jgi:hypothetical protein
MNRWRRMAAFVASNPAYFHGGSIEPSDDQSGPRPPDDLAAAAREDELRAPRLLPTEAEVANLPRAARLAFVARCAERVAPLDRPDGPADLRGVGRRVTDAADPAAELAAVLTRAATLPTPLTRQLRAVRRDFDRLAKLAAAHHWADDTPVPADAFGPLWPDSPPAWWPAE